MDKIIRAAAEDSIHGYEDKSWKDMEVLLDKHLPEQKRRRWALFFFLFAAVAISGFLFVRQISSDKQPVYQNKNNTVPLTAAEQKQSNTATQLPLNNEKNKKIKDNKTTTFDAIPAQATPVDRIVNEQISHKNNLVIINPIKKENKLVQKNSYTSSYKPGTISVLRQHNKETNTSASAPAIPQSVPSNITATDAPVVASKTTTQTFSLPVGSVTDTTKNFTKTDGMDSSAVVANNPVKKERTRRKKGDKLSLNFSFGPDISAVGVDPGRFKMQYGIGVGYAISEKLSVRTGFYTGRKIYSADSNSYHVYPGGIYSFKLDYVKANCFVYEIPITVVYSFNRTKQHNWFVSAGLSSYLMKEENYEYHYKNSWGQTMMDIYEFRNKNSHFFSVVSLSGGYQHHFNKRFSILAEPYVKMPVTGVGVGKVRLNTTGVLFTASLKPFLK